MNGRAARFMQNKKRINNWTPSEYRQNKRNYNRLPWFIKEALLTSKVSPRAKYWLINQAIGKVRKQQRSEMMDWAE